MIENEKSKEKALILIVDTKPRELGWGVEELREEMEELVKACGGEPAAHVICRLDKPNAGYLIGAGKVEEAAGVCHGGGIDLVVVSHDLKGSQQRNLEESFKVKTIDRTQLILDIFARRAASQEGKMQVELAQLEYRLPRLVGKSPELSRLGGGIGTVGPGETKLEVDRRRIGARIAHLKSALTELAAGRSMKRKNRNDKGVPLVSLVGYTNAGKSTLFNALTSAEQITRQGLFTTLDSVSRQLTLPNHQKVVLSDTVGFLHALPHRLIEAFKATLEEVVEASLLLHVVDVSHPHFREHFESVNAVLREIGAGDKPIVVALNKIDKLEDRTWLRDLRNNLSSAVEISAKTGENFDALTSRIEEMLSDLFVEIDVTVPLSRMDLVNLAHSQGSVVSVEYLPEGVHIHASIPARMASQFNNYLS